MKEKLSQKVISILSDDARITAKEIAVMLGEDEHVVQNCINELENEGIIVKYCAVINTEKLHQNDVQALIEVKVSPTRNEGFDAMAERLMAHDEVKSVYLMSGTYDLMLIIEGKSLKDVALFVSERLSTLENVISTATHFILKKYKMDGVVLNGNQTEHRLVVSP